jgi:hypothetical protein
VQVVFAKVKIKTKVKVAPCNAAGIIEVSKVWIYSRFFSALINVGRITYVLSLTQEYIYYVNAHQFWP